MAVHAGQKLKASDLGQSTTCAEYNATSDQAITTGTDTILAFGTTNSASSLVTRAVDGVGHSFTLEREGIWAITTSILWEALTAGERWVTIEANGTPVALMPSHPSAALFLGQNVSITRPFAENDVIHIIGFQSKGSNVNSVADNARALGRINLCWLGG